MTDRDRTEEERERLTARQNSIHVVHVDGHQLEVRPLFGKIIESALEFAHFPVDSSTSLREDDQRIDVFNLPDHEFDRALMNFDLLPVDQHGIE